MHGGLLGVAFCPSVCLSVCPSVYLCVCPSVTRKKVTRKNSYLRNRLTKGHYIVYQHNSTELLRVTHANLKVGLLPTSSSFFSGICGMLHNCYFSVADRSNSSGELDTATIQQLVQAVLNATLNGTLTTKIVDHIELRNEYDNFAASYFFTVTVVTTIGKYVRNRTMCGSVFMLV